MQKICALDPTVGPFLPIVLAIVFVVPITPSPMMISPSNPNRSLICVAVKDNFLQDIEITIVPIHSTNRVTYTPMSTPVRFWSTAWNAPKMPPKTPAITRKRSAFSANGRVRRW